MYARTISLFITLTAGMFLGGCTDFSNNPDEEDYYGSGRLISEQRSANTFTGIRLTGIGKVVVTQSNTEGVRVEADDNIIDRVTTSVQSGVLLIGMKRGSYHNVTVNVYVSMKTVEVLELVGAGEFRSAGSIQSDDVLCRITGAGEMTLSGTAANQTIQITGAGSVRNFDLTSTTCSATISGTGNIEVTVTQRLDAIITGVGNITYGGNPPTVNQTVTGVGSVRRQ
ncbi:MAG TPA: head GIN domain-containing protein [Bacteroidota bacterium]